LDISSINFQNIANSDITINKIFIEYYVPLCVLLPKSQENQINQQNLQNFINLYHIAPYFSKDLILNNNNYIYKKFNNYNYNYNNNNPNKNFILTQNSKNQNNNRCKNPNLNNIDNFQNFSNNQFYQNSFKENINRKDNKYNQKFINSRKNDFQKRYDYQFQDMNSINEVNCNFINDFKKNYQNNIIKHINTLNKDKYFLNLNKAYADIHYKSMDFKNFENLKIQNSDEINSSQTNTNSKHNQIPTENTDYQSFIQNQENKKKNYFKINKKFNKYDISDPDHIKIDKIRDFIPKNFVHKITQDSNKNENSNKINTNQFNQDNYSINSSLLSLGTSTSIISNKNSINLEEEDDNLLNLKNNSNMNNNTKEQGFNQKYNQFSIYSNQENFKISEKSEKIFSNKSANNENYNFSVMDNCKNLSNNLNLNDNIMFSNDKFDFNKIKNFNFPVIFSPTSCNININLNPQIYGNILFGENLYSKKLNNISPQFIEGEILNLNHQNWMLNKNISLKDQDDQPLNQNINLNKNRINNKNNLSFNNFYRNFKPNNPLLNKLENCNENKKSLNSNYMPLIKNDTSNNKNNLQKEALFDNNRNEESTEELGFLIKTTNIFNFCNWFSFMTNTTPLIKKNEEITLKNFFNSFKRYSIFGVDCTFKFNNKYLRKTYYPSFSSINIELNKSNINDNLNNTSNLNSTLDGSFFSHLSECENLTKTKNSVFYFEDLALHLRPMFCERANNFLKSNELENITLGEIAENSWFSILWTPEKNKYNNFHESFANFLIFYKIRPYNFNNKISYISVIGIFSGDIDDEIFWFSNQANIQYFNNNRNLQMIKEDFYKNRIEYLKLMVKNIIYDIYIKI